MGKAFQDKVVVVTGAGRGIGRASAEAFAQAGARVVLASRTESELINTAESIREKGGQALVCPRILLTSRVSPPFLSALKESGALPTCW
ncbi:SDR family NAD(P)-dependent oxidoreductase [bacterium]|nr:SDR family NAD(P)-dependent oxidoreductase [bacterium]